MFPSPFGPPFILSRCASNLDVNLEPSLTAVNALDGALTNAWDVVVFFPADLAGALTEANLAIGFSGLAMCILGRGKFVVDYEGFLIIKNFPNNQRGPDNQKYLR